MRQPNGNHKQLPPRLSIRGQRRSGILRRHGRIGPWAIFIGTLLEAACGEPPKRSGNGDLAHVQPSFAEGKLTLRGQRIRYQLTWDDQPPVTVLSGPNETFTITEAYLGTASIELVPCTEDEEQDPNESQSNLGVDSWFLRLLGPATAWADHSYVANSTLLVTPVAEQVGDPARRSYGETGPIYGTFCKLFYRTGPVQKATPSGVTLDRESARLEATSGQRSTTRLSAGLLLGAQVALEAHGHANGPHATFAVIELRRHLDQIPARLKHALPPGPEAAYQFQRIVAQSSVAHVSFASDP